MEWWGWLLVIAAYFLVLALLDAIKDIRSNTRDTAQAMRDIGYALDKHFEDTASALHDISGLLSSIDDRLPRTAKEEQDAGYDAYLDHIRENPKT